MTVDERLSDIERAVYLLRLVLLTTECRLMMNNHLYMCMLYLFCIFVIHVHIHHIIINIKCSASYNEECLKMAILTI